METTELCHPNFVDNVEKVAIQMRREKTEKAARQRITFIPQGSSSQILASSDVRMSAPTPHAIGDTKNKSSHTHRSTQRS